MIKRTLYISQPTILSLRNKQLVMQPPNGVPKRSKYAESDREALIRTFPVEDLGVVILDNKQITMTHGLMDALMQNNTALITCDNRSMPSGLFLPLEGNTLQSERFANQLQVSRPLKKQLWQQTIRQKILNQAAVLNTTTNVETRCMMTWAKDVKSGDSDNMEARAAAYYWKHLFAPHGIHNFVRGRDESPPNNLLNYGYAILRAVIARTLVGSGLLPTLGIHHHNRYNAYCLADDIMEPYRPFVDKLVVDIIKSNTDYSELSKQLKAQLLTIPTLDAVIANKKSPLMIAASITSASLAKCYGGELRKIVYPEIEAYAQPKRI